MSYRIRLSWPAGSAIATLDDSAESRALADALPSMSTAQTWGEEVYFSLPVEQDVRDDAQQVVDPGEVCFWVEGGALALPYGRTPISQGDESRLVAPCNRLGRLEEDARVLASVRDGDEIRVEVVD
ncbi:cyclophilin-like fold protein [Arhodomonas sp. AD133]|uniref:cyclophilin-like fold protein n=1 Tax=Arhodomonas sp. AD133 TaxID=3415009 RepID=UPI003EBFED46